MTSIKIVQMLERQGAMKAKTIAGKLGYTKSQAIGGYLASLCKQGRIKRVGIGMYQATKIYRKLHV